MKAAAAFEDGMVCLSGVLGESFQGVQELIELLLKPLPDPDELAGDHSFPFPVQLEAVGMPEPVPKPPEIIQEDLGLLGDQSRAIPGDLELHPSQQVPLPGVRRDLVLEEPGHGSEDVLASIVKAVEQVSNHDPIMKVDVLTRPVER